MQQQQNIYICETVSMLTFMQKKKNAIDRICKALSEKENEIQERNEKLGKLPSLSRIE